jgi:beta-lactamase superfamily II metal-dependent hydrolase
MLKLHVMQAKHGDSLILEYGTASDPRHTLIDGGPKTIYEDHLRHKLVEIRDGGGKLELVILSHVDEDHVYGLLELMSDLRHQRVGGDAETIAVDTLWHNTFSQTIGRDVQSGFRGLVADVPSAGERMVISARAERSINQGDQLQGMARGLGIKVNPQFSAHEVISVDKSPMPIQLGQLTLRIVGPTDKNLNRLRKEWLKWLKDQKKRVLDPDPAVAEKAIREADGSVPNRSSIMVLAAADDKTILLTGDGRGDHLLKGLQEAGLLDSDGSLHVDVLKVPHHGSINNVSHKFFSKVTADHYVVSADWEPHHHPDLEALALLAKAVQKQGRCVKIHVTNETESTAAFEAQYPHDQYGCELKKMKPGDHSMTIELA